ncbi:hypothetical protein GTP55_13150 [Duganella sp. FT109W]|uniref:Uncharacterized protein n=1 Tax=Duganella margarita TaxID=2692170 RepID=A0ABW9WIU4_9BURK|nr:hypothetical protein [Duganella margarita]MYN40323.1 hypothetical protein [Duganella margarita]
MFSFAIGLLAALISRICTRQNSWWPTLPVPALRPDFDISAFASVPWSVQATIVALVYPIVVSFIAILLQRKAHSTVALRAYLLDSGVVPSGASSIALLIAMGIQYLASPYATSAVLAQCFVPLIIANGAWLTINVLLTAFFLGRTMHFIQEEEQRRAYTRIAVDLVLRSELVLAVKQHLFVNAAQDEWRLSEYTGGRSPAPEVHMHGLLDGQSQVCRRNKTDVVLLDVHLHLLRVVAVSWSRRAANGAWADERRPSVLSFPPRIGYPASGNAALCKVDNGPSLTWFERWLVGAAFIYGPARRDTMSLSTTRMLAEIGSEVEVAVEQQRFGAAEESLKELMKLHTTLLLASVTPPEATVDNAAAINASPYGWGANSFSNAWLEPYIEIGRIAIACLEEDARLYRTLVTIPAKIALRIPPRPATLITEAQLVCLRLASQLGAWWLRKAADSAIQGGPPFGGTLVAPLNKIHEGAVVSLIGSWGHVYIPIDQPTGASDAEKWKVLAARADVYAKHIENSAYIFMQAVARGDIVGATWLLDGFLKWWGNRRAELPHDRLERDFRTRHVTITLSGKSWEAAKQSLWDGEAEVTSEFAGQALSLAIRRYWESTRLYLVLLLIRNASDHPSPDNLPLLCAGKLIRAERQQAGGEIQALSMDSIDAVLTAALALLHGVDSPVHRLDQFAERLSRDRNEITVSGWTYISFGNGADFESMQAPLAILLSALTADRNPLINSKRLIQNWWLSIERLQAVERYCATLHALVATDAFPADSAAAIAHLRRSPAAELDLPGTLAAVADAARTLERLAIKERGLTVRALSIDRTKVAGLLSAVTIEVFERVPVPSAIRQIRFDRTLATGGAGTSYRVRRERYLEMIASDYLDSAEAIGERVSTALLAQAFRDLVHTQALTAVNNPGWRDNYDPSTEDKQQLAEQVAGVCAELRARSTQPIILVGRSPLSDVLRHEHWGAGFWQCPVPPGVAIQPGVGDVLAHINGTPVCQFDTPDGDCYVLPATCLEVLRVQGDTADDALSVSWTPDGDHDLIFSFRWKAAF